MLTACVFPANTKNQEKSLNKKKVLKHFRAPSVHSTVFALREGLIKSILLFS